MYDKKNSTDEIDMLYDDTSIDKPKTKQMLVGLQTAAFLFGLALLVFVIYWIGLQAVVEVLSRVGWGIFFIVALNFARQLVRAFCIYLAIPPEHRSIKYHNVLAARLGGEAITAVTFTGPLLGDAAKMALLKKQVKLAHSAAAVVIDDILYYLSVLLVILSGVGLLLYIYGSGDVTMQYALAGVTAFTILIFAGLALTVVFEIKPVSFVFKRLYGRNLLPKFIAKGREYVYDIENNVYGFYHDRRSMFFALIGLDILAHAVSVTEVYVALRLLDLVPSISTAFIIESLTKVINLAFSFVPGGIGVYEGGNGVILNLLGYTATAGVALALVRRGGILFTTFIGLTVLWRRTVIRGTETLAKRVVSQDS